MSTALDATYQDSYNREAIEYDASRFGSTKRGFSARYKDELIERILTNRIGLSAQTRVLDCPSGTGRISHHLLRTEVGQIDAVDISSEMLAVNESKLSEEHRERVRFHVANMKELPFDDETFDAVVMGSFFYLVPASDYGTYVSDVYRVVKPGGTVVVEVSNAWPAYNPRNLVHVIGHRVIRRRAVKSYVSPLSLRQLFSPFRYVAYYGTEFPLIGARFDAYSRYSRFLGATIPFRWFAGKFTAVLEK